MQNITDLTFKGDVSTCIFQFGNEADRAGWIHAGSAAAGAQDPLSDLQATLRENKI